MPSSLARYKGTSFSICNWCRTALMIFISRLNPAIWCKNLLLSVTTLVGLKVRSMTFVTNQGVDAECLSIPVSYLMYPLLLSAWQLILKIATKNLLYRFHVIFSWDISQRKLIWWLRNKSVSAVCLCFSITSPRLFFIFRELSACPHHSLGSLAWDRQRPLGRRMGHIFTLLC